MRPSAVATDHRIAPHHHKRVVALLERGNDLLFLLRRTARPAKIWHNRTWCEPRPLRIVVVVRVIPCTSPESGFISEMLFFSTSTT